MKANAHKLPFCVFQFVEVNYGLNHRFGVKTFEYVIKIEGGPSEIGKYLTRYVSESVTSSSYK